MDEVSNEIWIESFFNKIKKPYPFISLFIAVIIYIIYWFLSTKIYYFPWDFVDRLVVSTLSILIAFQFAGIQYVLTKIKKDFNGLFLLPNNIDSVDNVYVEFEKRFYGSYWYYVIVALVIVPFILFSIINIINGGNTYYTLEPTIWSFLMDIYNNVVGYLMLYLLAIILWIIINIAWIFIEIETGRFRKLMEVNVFAVDKIGGFKPLRNFILKYLIFYFICLTLAIISYISPDRFFSYESFFLIMLLILGFYFFLLGLSTIQKIVKGKMKDEIDRINEEYQKEYQRFMEIISKGDNEAMEKDLNRISMTLETLNNERERRLQLYDNTKGYDLMTAIEFMGSFIPPIIALIQKFIPIETYLLDYLKNFYNNFYPL